MTPPFSVHPASIYPCEVSFIDETDTLGNVTFQSALDISAGPLHPEDELSWSLFEGGEESRLRDSFHSVPAGDRKLVIRRITATATTERDAIRQRRLESIRLVKRYR